MQAKGEWRVRDPASRRSASGSAPPTTRHDELAIHDPDDEPTTSSWARASPTASRKARVEMQHSPVMTGLGELTGAVGVHVDNRKTRGESFEGDSLLEPAHTQSVAAFWFEELALTQGAARPGRGAHRAHDRRRHGLVGCHRIRQRRSSLHGERAFTPVSGGLGLLYASAVRASTRLNGQYVERAPDAAELFSKGMHEATGTFEIGNPFLDEEKASTAEIGLKKAHRRRSASMPRPTTRAIAASSIASSPASPAARFSSSCDAAGPAGDETFDQVVFQQRNATFYGAELARPVRRGADLERRVGRRRAVRLRARPVRGRRERAAHPAAPARRRRLLSRRQLARPRRRCCTPSIRTSSASTRSRRRATRWSRPS